MWGCGDHIPCACICIYQCWRVADNPCSTSLKWKGLPVELNGQNAIGSMLNPLAGKFSKDTRKKGKGAKTGASHDMAELLFVAIWLAKG